MDKESGIFLVKEGVPTILSPGLTWLVVRTYDEFVKSIYEYIEEHHEFPPLIVLTSNLDEEHELWFQSNLGRVPQYDKFRNKSGMHCLSFLMEFSDVLKLPIKKMSVNGTRHAETILRDVFNKWRVETGCVGTTPACYQMDWQVKTMNSEDRPEDNTVQQGTMATDETGGKQDNVSPGGILLP